MLVETTTHKKKIGVAIAGLGFGEKVHLEAVKNNPGFELISLWHHQKERVEKTCKEHNLKVHKDWEDLLNNKNIDAIIIATPPKPRYWLAKQALIKGKHLLLEKPVTLTVEEAKQLQKISITNKLSVAVDFEYRAVPLFLQLKNILEKNIIGDPWLIKVDWLMSGRANKERPWNWYSDDSQGGGVLGALGTHAFDILHWLIGPTKNISASFSTAIKQRKEMLSNKKLNVTSDDIALLHLDLQSNQYNSTVPAQLTLSAVTKNGRGFWIEIYGSKGTLILGSDNQNDYVHGFGLWCSINNEPLKRIPTEGKYAFTKTWTDGRVAPVGRIQEWWRESIVNSYPIIPGIAEGVASQEVCDKARYSHESSQRQNTSFF